MNHIKHINEYVSSEEEQINDILDARKGKLNPKQIEDLKKVGNEEEIDDFVDSKEQLKSQLIDYFNEISANMNKKSLEEVAQKISKLKPTVMEMYSDDTEMLSLYDKCVLKWYSAMNMFNQKN